MLRLDITKLRKEAGMSQRELADHLQVQPSFLSAIENGRSRVPDSKLPRIKEIFGLDSFDDYMLPDEEFTAGSIPPHTHEIPPHTHHEGGDSITQLLNHLHDLAHRNSPSSSNPELMARIDFLTQRNDRLSDRLDNLRDEVDALKAENFRLKELLIRNNIPFN